MTEQRKTVAIGIEPSLLDEVNRLAYDKGRSMSAKIRYILQDWINTHNTALESTKEGRAKNKD